MVNETDKVDFVSIDDDDNIVLTISDHLEWDENNEHIFTLQAKINRYLAFIESGELCERYPDARGKKPFISVVALYPPNEIANTFLGRVREVVKDAGFGFRFRQKHFNAPT